MAASKLGVQLWTASKIPLEPFDSHPSKKAILDAMGEIEKNSVIWFGKRGNEPNYIYILPAIPMGEIFRPRWV